MNWPTIPDVSFAARRPGRRLNPSIRPHQTATIDASRSRRAAIGKAGWEAEQVASLVGRIAHSVGARAMGESLIGTMSFLARAIDEFIDCRVKRFDEAAKGAPSVSIA